MNLEKGSDHRSGDDYSRVLITGGPRMANGASRQTLEDLRRFSGELGFMPIEQLSVLNPIAPLSWIRLLLNMRQVKSLLLAYPYACRPFDNPLRDVELNLIRRMSEHRFSIMYVVDLPIEQCAAFGDPKAIDEGSRRVERELFESMDRILVFNDSMRQRIQANHGIEDDRFVLFEILDYGVRQPECSAKEYSPPFRIAFAGNLSQAFLGQVISDLPIDDGITYHFFGGEGEWINGLGRHLVLHGYRADPYDMVSEMSQLMHYGLIIRDLGNQSITEYQNFGSTSKFSAYMVSGLPVLVPSDYEYVSEITRRYGVGLVFGSPQEIPGLIASITEEEYDAMRRNAIELGSKVSDGHFFKRAMMAAMNGR